MRWVRSGIAAAVVAVVAFGAPSAAGADGGGRRDLRVMTQNLYLGSSLDAALTPPPPGVPPDAALVGAVAQIYGTVVATNFPVRAAAIAREVDVERPDLIGLQEVSNWCVRRAPAFAECDPAASFDFLQILLDELGKRGLDYGVATVSENVMVPPVGFPLPGIPLLSPAKGCAVVSPAPACLVSFLDRDVILVNEQSSGLTWSNATSGHFQAQQLVPVPVVGSLSFNRGWAFIDGVFRGDKFRFVTTHLEVETFRDKQEAQARELVAGPLKTLRPVILVGDLNSAADGSTTDSYRILLRALFADAWWTNFGKVTGFTCCQAEKLDNEESMLSSRIDFVLTRLALPTSAHLVNEDKIATSPAPPPLWASDHAGVAATVHLL